MTENEATKTAATRKPSASRRGVWVSYRTASTGNAAPLSITPHSSEVNALREAVKIGGSAKFVEYGTELVD